MEVVKLLRRELKDKVLTEPEDLYAYTSDASTVYKQVPLAVVRAYSTEDVSKVLRIAHETGTPVVTRGGGTSLTGASVPVEGSIVLDVTPMDRVEVNVDDGWVMAEAGATVAKVDQECRKYGFFFPPDPASSRYATIGAALAENAGGLRGAKYGVMKNWVLSIEVVIPGGEVIRIGKPLYKWRWGPDLISLFVGSEGTLGVITRAWLRIYPLPEHVVRILGLFDRLEDAGKAIFEIRRSGILPTMMELLDEESVDIVRRQSGLEVPEVEALIIVDVDGPRESVWRLAEEVKSIIEKNGGKAEASDDPEEMKKLYAVRQGIYAAVTRTYRGVLIEDVVFPVSKLVEALSGLKKIKEKYGLPMPTFGHAGDGNLHPNICYDPDDPDQVRKAEEMFREVALLAIRLGGSLSGEHGIGLVKKELFLEELKSVNSLGYLRLIKEIKRLIDPKGIMNPGKLFPD